MRWAAYKTSFEFRLRVPGLSLGKNPLIEIFPARNIKTGSKANLKLGTGNSKQFPGLASHMCVGALTGGVPSRIAIIHFDVREKS